MEHLYTILFFIGITILIIINSTKFKGWYGEYKVKRFLYRKQKKNKLLVINDLRFYNNKNKSVQIDHVIISNDMVICIETKNYSGKIYGSIKNETWYKYYQTNNKKKQKYEFYNPIMQNKNHIKYLNEKISLDKPILNIVVDTGKSEYKNKYDEILRLYQFKLWINKNCNTVNENDRLIYNEIKSIHKNISNKEHIQNIKN